MDSMDGVDRVDGMDKARPAPRPSSTTSTASTKSTSAEISANGVLAFLAVDCELLDRQLAAQAKAFEDEGGFTERLYRVRSRRRRPFPSSEGD